MGGGGVGLVVVGVGLRDKLVQGAVSLKLLGVKMVHQFVYPSLLSHCYHNCFCIVLVIVILLSSWPCYCWHQCFPIVIVIIILLLALSSCCCDHNYHPIVIIIVILLLASLLFYCWHHCYPIVITIVILLFQV